MSNDTLSNIKRILLSKADKRFKKVSVPDEGKFNRLPKWLDDVSYRYEKEFDHEFPKHYYHYKRGTVILVDFGVNMGSEFSFTHFAIVLDKKDNARKKTLTVLPLTSKQKKGRFSLGKEVFNQTVFLINQSGIREVKRTKKLNDRLKNCPKNSEEYREIQAAIDASKKDRQKLFKVAEIYANFNKNSFVRLSDITTVSKFRIKRINKFDPSGKIRLSGQQMAAISNELMKLYISDN